MSKNSANFFSKKQTEITSLKLELYNKYIKAYSMILLMHSGKIFIADLFSGPGMNGDDKGSPLLLIDTLNETLDNESLRKKHSELKAVLLFNDKNPKNSESLTLNLKEQKIHKNISAYVRNKVFEDILSEMDPILQKSVVPKLFFLDPYSYSTVKMEQLVCLFKYRFSEIILFAPTFDAYRFRTADKIVENEEHKTRQFIEEYCARGLDDYEDIHDFNTSIGLKLRESLGTDYVKYVLLDGGKRKHAVFHITNHLKGSLQFNKVARKMGDLGKGVNLKEKELKELKGQGSLFSDKETDIYYSKMLKSFGDFLIEELKENKMTNVQIIELCAINGILPEEASAILKENSHLLEIEYLEGKGRGNYVAEGNWNSKKCTIGFKK